MAVVLSPHSSNFLFEHIHSPPPPSPSLVSPDSETLSPRIDLSEVDLHQWPESYNAAVSKLLDNAGIPNVLWGDLLNRWRGSPHIPQVRVISPRLQCILLMDLWRIDVWVHCPL